METSELEDSFGKENTVEAGNIPVAKAGATSKNAEHPMVAPSPNTMRKRRREEIAKKVESRKALISTACSSRLDMTKVHSILSGPRLSWDWQGGLGGTNAGPKEDEEDDSCGLIVDFHQDSRSALRTHISKAMSQMASRDISSQSTAAIPVANARKGNSEEIKQIIQMKRRLISSQAVASQAVHEVPKPVTVPEDEELGLPVLEPLSSNPVDDEINLWQETQQVISDLIDYPEEEEIIAEPEATQVFVRTAVEDIIEPTQVFIRQSPVVDDTPAEEELIIDPTQIYVPEPQPVASKNPVVEEKISKASSNVSIPPNSVRDGASSDDNSEEESSGEEEEEPKKEMKKSKAQMSFEEWLLDRKRRRKQRKQESKEARSFFEAEAEESEDEELGGIVRRRPVSGESGSEDSSSGDEDSDLEDLVASAADEFALIQKGSKKDSKKLAKLHAKWMEEKDAELEKAIEDRNFWNRRQQGRGSNLLDEAAGGEGLSRLQRKMKAKQRALVEQFDAEGNVLAPEYVSDSEYDSMEIDSDEFFDEFDSEFEDKEGVLDPEELAERKERKQRDMERRKRDLEMKAEMKNRRQVLKEKLRQERMQREKDKREIQAGLGIMTEEDRQAFKLVSRTQGVFGYTQASGITTQSTSASASVSQSPVFSFLAGTTVQEQKPRFRSRRSSIGALELE